MARYKAYDTNQGYFITLQPEIQFSEYSIERVIDRFVEEHVDLSRFDKAYSNDTIGPRAIHPFAKLKVILYAFSQGMQSSHQIEKMLAQGHLGYVYLSANTRMDHSTLCDFITTFQEEIYDVFWKLLTVLNEMELIDWQLIMIDGTKISSAASKEMTGDEVKFRKKRKYFQRLSEKIVKRAKQTSEDEKEGKILGDKARREEKKIQRQQGRYERIIQEIDEYEKEVKEGKIDAAVNTNLTDRESRLLKTSDGFIQGYNVQAAFSANDIIVAVEAVSQENDQGLLKGEVYKVEEVKTKLGVTTQSAYMSDKGYCDSRQITELDEEGKDIYCAIPKTITNGWIQDEKYSVVRDGERMQFQCYRGIKQYGSYDKAEDAYVFTIKKDRCQDCENQPVCWKGREKQNKRKFKVSSVLLEKKEQWSAYMDKMDSEQGKRIYNQRLGKEHNFNDMKHHNGLSYILRRGKKKATLEAVLAAIAHNLKKLSKYMEESAIAAAI